MDTQTITLRLPASLVERIEETARRRGRSRSALFEEALRQYLAGDQLSRSEADMTVARDAGTDEPLYKLNEG
ncbi:ribbon-helix-helix protein, CopG family [Bordetella genomosp. 9]|uniref:ribbon-helix-helix protein, CopG family n=1 Tax=Bordetella genomosp. 9 TaxID=1416803 RepID=UPI0012F73B45|nr:ribbon-helix-helix protein, CopG family [Bordetella genomosp. 9]